MYSIMSSPNFTDNSILVVSVLSIVLGSFILCLKILYKSKCANFSLLYGLINVQRNVEIETDIEIDKIPIPTQNIHSTNV